MTNKVFTTLVDSIADSITDWMVRAGEGQFTNHSISFRPINNRDSDVFLAGDRLSSLVIGVVIKDKDMKSVLDISDKIEELLTDFTYFDTMYFTCYSCLVDSSSLSAITEEETYIYNMQCSISYVDKRCICFD